MQPEERRILIVSCFGHFMSHFSVMVVPAIIIPLAASMNLSVADILGLTFPQDPALRVDRAALGAGW